MQAFHIPSRILSSKNGSVMTLDGEHETVSGLSVIMLMWRSLFNPGHCGKTMSLETLLLRNILWMYTYGRTQTHTHIHKQCVCLYTIQ